MFWKKKYDLVVKEILENCIQYECEYNCNRCEMCFCRMARLVAEKKKYEYVSWNPSYVVCTKCYYDYLYVHGLYLQHLYG